MKKTPKQLKNKLQRQKNNGAISDLKFNYVKEPTTLQAIEFFTKSGLIYAHCSISENKEFEDIATRLNNTVDLLKSDPIELVEGKPKDVYLLPAVSKDKIRPRFNHYVLSRMQQEGLDKFRGADFTNPDEDITIKDIKDYCSSHPDIVDDNVEKLLESFN